MIILNRNYRADFYLILRSFREAWLTNELNLVAKSRLTAFEIDFVAFTPTIPGHDPIITR